VLVVEAGDVPRDDEGETLLLAVLDRFLIDRVVVVGEVLALVQRQDVAILDLEVTLEEVTQRVGDVGRFGRSTR